MLNVSLHVCVCVRGEACVADIDIPYLQVGWLPADLGLSRLGGLEVTPPGILCS